MCKWCKFCGSSDAQDKHVFCLLPSIARSIMELTSSFAKHVLTLIITFSAAVMDAQDPNMFGMSSTTCSMMELLCCVPSEAVMQVL